MVSNAKKGKLFTCSSNPGAREVVQRWQGKALNKWKDLRPCKQAAELLGAGCHWCESLKWVQDEDAQGHVRDTC